MKPSDLIAELRGIRRHTIEVQVVTAAECADVAHMARRMTVDPPDPMWAENSRWPWEPNVDLAPIIMEPGTEGTAL